MWQGPSMVSRAPTEEATQGRVSDVKWDQVIHSGPWPGTGSQSPSHTKRLSTQESRLVWGVGTHIEYGGCHLGWWLLVMGYLSMWKEEDGHIEGSFGWDVRARSCEKSFRAQGYPAWAVRPKNGDEGVCIKPLSSQMVQGRKNVFLLYLNVFWKFKIVSTGKVIQ